MKAEKNGLVERSKLNAEPYQRISNYKVWQDGNHPIWIDTPDFMKQKLAYIHDKPVTEGVVEEPKH